MKESDLKIGIPHSQFTTLPWPWGNCTEQSEHGVYTYSACIRECEIEALEVECKCRDAFMYGDPEGNVLDITFIIYMKIPRTNIFLVPSLSIK